MFPIFQDEAERCLLCKNPKCQSFCPIDTPIPKVIALNKKGKLEEAGKLLFDIAFHKWKKKFHKRILKKRHLNPVIKMETAWPS